MLICWKLIKILIFKYNLISSLITFACFLSISFRYYYIFYTIY